jgi:hypothetical protein
VVGAIIIHFQLCAKCNIRKGTYACVIENQQNICIENVNPPLTKVHRYQRGESPFHPRSFAE